MHKVLAISLALTSCVMAISPIVEAKDHRRQQTTTANAAKCEAPASFSNPKVQPGLVRWHKTIEAAEAASKKSGKPVFVLQMLGRMDDHFC